MRRALAVLIALVVWSTLSSLAIGAGPSTSLRVDRLEQQIERVEAISAIKRLQHAYGHYAELGLWHDFADLFADSGIGHYAQGDLNREGIRSLFLKEVGGGRVGLADGRIYPHISMQPVVTLADDGQSARGRWHIMAMLGGYGTTASWAGGIYENQYVRENGVWKMKDVRYLQQYSGRYENPGWTATKDATPFHFDASGIGRPTSEPRTASSESRSDSSTLAARVADLSARAQRLSDEIAITNLQHAYGYYVDGRMWDDVADLFAGDGTMEIGLQGVYVGRAGIRRGLNAVGPAGIREGEINDHVHLETIVTVMPDGRGARARGSDIGMTKPGSQALLSQSIYENEFVKQGSVWKFKTLHVYPRFIVDAEKGWAKDAQPAPGPSREFPPDRPPTQRYEIYPRFYSPPIHFDHPVTGPLRHPESVTAPRPADIESLLTATERSIERSTGYYAVEQVSSAYGYGLDDRAHDKAPDVFALHQIVQPVIDVSADGRSAKARARLFQLGGPAGGEGAWTSGIYENAFVNDNGTWKLSAVNQRIVWTAPSRGGWVHVTSAPNRAPAFHYRNPVSGRVPPASLP